MKKLMIVLAAVSLLVSCKPGSEKNEKLKKSVMENTDFKFVKQKALEVVKTGFNAGDGYGEVWIRDYATFIELSAEVYPKEILKENLRVFFRLQGSDGNIIDGFIPKEKAVNVEGGTHTSTTIWNQLTVVTRIRWKPIMRHHWCRRFTSTFRKQATKTFFRR